MIYSDHIDDLKAAIRQINESPLPTIQLTKCRQGYVCPNCNNGSGGSSTGITKKYGRWHCFKCGYSASNLDMYMIQNNLDINNKNDIATAAKQLLRIIPAEPSNSISPAVKKEPPTDNMVLSLVGSSISPRVRKEPQVNMCTQYRIWLNNALNSPEAIAYWENRGITTETMEKYQLGFMRDQYNIPRVVIPVTKYSYNTRRIDNESTYKFIKHGQTSLYFERRLINSAASIIIVESEIDALSIVQSGFNAVALGGVGNTSKLVAAVNKYKPATTILLACDNDAAGQSANKAMHACISNSKIINPYGAYKDANEMLIGLGYKLFTEELKQYVSI